jgi:hypothetical protein
MLTLSIAALVVSSTTAASEIYQWTDDEGNVHYEDRPIAREAQLRRDILSARTDNATVQARVQQHREARAAAEQVASEAPEEMSKEEVRAEQQKRQCTATVSSGSSARNVFTRKMNRANGSI